MRKLIISPDHARLLASLGFNLLSKLPGIAAVFIVLPLISRALGPASYGELLSALALGSLSTVPFGGINAVGLRLLARAVGAKDKISQANIFMTTASFVAAVAVFLSIGLVLATRTSWSDAVFIYVSLLPILAALLNTFDNLRASYNEHYVTASLNLIFQIPIYAAIYFWGLRSGWIFLSSLALVGPSVSASLSNLALLLFARPFLLTGKVEGLYRMVPPAIGVMMASGAIGAIMPLSVSWLDLAGSPQMAAWVGTFARLFTSFQSPVLLILFPITSYISMRWIDMTDQVKFRLHNIFIVAGFSYGIVAGSLMFVAGPVYIDHMFNLMVHGDSFDVFSISVFMGSVIAQSAYTLLLYAVAEARFVSYGSALVAASGACAAAVSRAWLSPSRTIDVLFLVTGLGFPVVLLIGGYRHRRELRAPRTNRIAQGAGQRSS